MTRRIREHATVYVAAGGADMLLRLPIESERIISFGDIAVARAIQEGLLESILHDRKEPQRFPFSGSCRRGANPKG